MNDLVKEKFIAYQSSYKEGVDKLISGNYKEWKGFITVNGPVVKSPKILFIGINPGQGLYNDGRIPFRVWQEGKLNEYIEKKIADGRSIKFTEIFHRKGGNREDITTIALDCFTRGNYEDGKSWYQEGKCINNFAKNTVAIIRNVAKCLSFNEIEEDGRPAWYDKHFGKSIMFLNVYPYATENTKALNNLLCKSKIDVEEPIKALRDLIKTLEPDVIVFLGTTALQKLKSFKKYNIPHVVINRCRNRKNRNWNNANYQQEKAEEIAKHIEQKK